MFENEGKKVITKMIVHTIIAFKTSVVVVRIEASSITTIYDSSRNCRC